MKAKNPTINSNEKKTKVCVVSAASCTHCSGLNIDNRHPLGTLQFNEYIAMHLAAALRPQHLQPVFNQSACCAAAVVYCLFIGT